MLTSSNRLSNLGKIKRYDTDHIKKESRKILLSAISEHLLKTKSSENIQVLCLAGVNASEVLEVYDQLKIPRCNVTIVERDPKIAKHLKNTVLGATVFEGSVIDFVTTHKTFSFDVFSVDYLGDFSSDNLLAIDYLTTRNTREGFVFHQANSTKRGKHSAFLYGSTIGISPTYKLYVGDTSEVQNQEHKFEEVKQKSSDSLQARSDIYSDLLRRQCTSRVNVMEAIKFLFGPTSAEYEKKLMEKVNGYEKHNNLPITGSIGESCDDLSNTSQVIIHANLRRVYLGRINSILGKNKTVEISNQDIATASGAFTIRFSPHSRLSQTIARYSYISESGTPMLGDILYVGSVKRKIETLVDEITSTVGYHTFSRYEKAGYVPAPERWSFQTKLADFYGLIKDRLDSAPSRIFLGNAAKPFLTKKKAIELLKTGMQLKDLLATYRGGEKLSLPQLKAHVTMGTYGPKLNESPPLTFERPLTLVPTRIGKYSRLRKALYRIVEEIEKEYQDKKKENDPSPNDRIFRRALIKRALKASCEYPDPSLLPSKQYPEIIASALLAFYRSEKSKKTHARNLTSLKVDKIAKDEVVLPIQRPTIATDPVIRRAEVQQHYIEIVHAHYSSQMMFPRNPNAQLSDTFMDLLGPGSVIVPPKIYSNPKFFKSAQHRILAAQDNGVVQSSSPVTRKEALVEFLVDEFVDHEKLVHGANKPIYRCDEQILIRQGYLLMHLENVIVPQGYYDTRVYFKRHSLPIGQAITAPRAELAIGMLFMSNLDLAIECGIPLSLLEAAKQLGEPGVSAIGIGIICHLPWTECVKGVALPIFNSFNYKSHINPSPTFSRFIQTEDAVRFSA